LEQDKFTLLHVGHIMPRRNLGIFSRIDSSKYQSLIVASEYLKLDEPMYNQLKENGCKIITGYIKDLQEVYGMCDCYVFPVRPGQTVMMPLTVFEAMSCNMPVITTEFEALKEMFTEGNGLIFVKDVEEILSSLESLKVNMQEVKTREMILLYSWVNIGKKIGAVYDEVIKERG
jgi:glycosyltransferase involved in cell wall biosynthesis